MVFDVVEMHHQHGSDNEMQGKNNIVVSEKDATCINWFCGFFDVVID